VTNQENVVRDTRVRKQIIESFKTTSINHIVFELGYTYNIDAITNVIREYIANLEKELGYDPTQNNL
jgi:signal recognition particle subunit SEC65